MKLHYKEEVGKNEKDDERKSSRLKEGLLAVGKFLNRKLPMKELLIATGVCLASQALPKCTTEFKEIKHDVDEDIDGDGVDGMEEVLPDGPEEDMPDGPEDTMDEDIDDITDVDIDDMGLDDGREPCPMLPESERIVNDIDLLEGESIVVNSIGITPDRIDVDALEVHYSFSCSGIPLEGGLTVTGEVIIRARSYPDDGVHIIINQQDVMGGRVIFNATIRQL